MRRLFSIICAALAAVAGPVAAETIEVRSDNFVFIGNVKEDRARELVTELEIYRSTVLALLGTEGREIRPVHIYGVQRTSQIRDLTGISGAAGVYTKGNDGPVFVMDLYGIYSRDDYSREIALHEYAHHIIGAHTEEFYPQWYNEGFAEYLGAFEFEDNIVSIGLPSSRFGEALNERPWVDIGLVLNAVTSYPELSKNDRVRGYQMWKFYGVSWIAVHYLFNTPELLQLFPEYIRQINLGTDPKQAFEDSFGMTQQEFENRLQSYWRADLFASIRFEYSGDTIASGLETRLLDNKDAALDMMMGQRNFITPGDHDRRFRRETRRELERLEERYGADPRLKAAYVALELAERDFGAAVRHGEEAVAAAPDSPVALLAAGDAYYHRHELSAPEDRLPEDIPRMRELFSALLAIDPTHPTGHDHYATSFLFDQATPDETALDSARFVARYYRNPRYMRTHLQLAEIWLLAGETGMACAEIGKVSQWVRAEAARAGEEEEEEDSGDPAAENLEKDIDHLERLERMPGLSCPA